MLLTNHTVSQYVLAAYKTKSAHQIVTVISILVYEAESAGKDSQWGNSSVMGEGANGWQGLECRPKRGWYVILQYLL